MLSDLAVSACAEFLGTAVLVFTIGCNVLSSNGIWGVVSTVCVFIALVYIFTAVSGAHFNPAVTLAHSAIGKMTNGQALLYIAAQLGGGGLGAVTYRWLFYETVFFAPMAGVNPWSAATVEGIYTFMLCLVVLNSATQRSKGHQFYGIAIGMVLAAGGFGAGALSGGTFNPAVAIAMDFASAGLGFGWSLVYVGFQLVGTALACVCYRCLRPQEFYAGTSREYNFSDTTLNRMITGELIGSFLIVLTFALGAAANSPGAALGVGAAVLSMTFSLGDICGVHFNPAITIAVTASCRGKCSSSEAFRFIVAQLLGAALAATVASILNPTEAQLFTHGFSIAGAAFAELIFTFLVCLTFLATIISDEPWKVSEYFGIAMGWAVIAAGYASQRISGGFLNPASSCALCLTGPHAVSTLFFRGVSYMLAECLGAFLAATFFWHVCPDVHDTRRLAAAAYAKA
mmetsp:Transcript_56283/g.131878  ORF Transcript_56283/g.131878 Transcript_56283/m.131878 type:complete len:457 (+) Transcript_56283:63-1433(+)